MKDIIIRSAGIAGIVAGLAAFVTSAVFPEKRYATTALTTASLASLLFFFIVHFEAFKSFSRKRSTQFGLNSLLMVVLFVFILLVLNLMIRQYYFRFDLSSTRSYSLAPQTKNVLKQLDSVVRITVFGREGDPSFMKTSELLEGYRYLNGNILYSLMDLDKAPQRARELGVSQYNSVVVQGIGAPVAAQGIDQQTITNAIINATRTSRKKILFSSGQGERSIAGEGRNGMSLAAARLRSIGYEVGSLSLPGVDAVPEDAEVFVIAGPRGKFSRKDLAKLGAFTKRGGKLVVLLDPGYDPSPVVGRTGIRSQDGTIIDPSSNFGGTDENMPLVSTYPDSPVTRDFGLSTVFPGAAPLLIDDADKTYERFTIAESSPNSRLMRGGKSIDARGAYILAAAAGSKSGKDITVVFGSADFASNAFIDVAGNANLLLNCINWMAGEAGLVSITPRKDDFVPLYLTPGQSAVILYFSVIGVPVSVFGTGLVIWWKRKRL